MSEFLIQNFNSSTVSKQAPSSEIYEKRLHEISSVYHSQCIFKHHPPIENLRFNFFDDGVLCGTFVPSCKHQGYDSMVHGGIIAAIIDASMAQCLMGHGIVAYTAELSIRYIQPVVTYDCVEMRTSIVDKYKNRLFQLECSINQNSINKVNAHAKFVVAPGG
jgi:acyl-coenzyme A thioesterase PaaI-like protein